MAARQRQRRAVGYVRVSVDNERKVSPEMQADAISKLCAAKGWDLVHSEVERGRSAGTGKKRPGLDLVREMIRCGEADTLVVWKLDRCSRSVHDFSMLLEELRDRDAGFVSCTENFDTSDPIGEAMVQITMVFAQLERARSSQRTAAWHAHRARRGDPYLGRPPFGYVRARDEAGRPIGPLEIDEATAPLVREAAELFLATGSMMAVQQFLEDRGQERWGMALRRGLASPQLAGIRIVDGVPIRGTWPAILDVATHQAIVAELNKPERGRGRPAGERWLLSGLLVCGRCGRPMMSAGRRKVKAKGGAVRFQRHYRCARVRNETTGCGAGISADPLEAWVEEQVLAAVSPQRWRTLRAACARGPVVDTGRVEGDLAALARRYGAGDLLEVEWNAARQVLLERLAEADDHVPSRRTDLPDVTDLRTAWSRGDLSVADKRLVIAAVIERITINQGVRGRALIGNRPQDRAVIAWHSDEQARFPATRAT
jgi:DNA invertase Pin-like site-specific DNA recombinase